MLLVGGSGSGKTRLALQFPVSAAQDCKQPGIVIVLNDTLRWLRKTATLIGLVAAIYLVVLLPAAIAQDKVTGLSSVLGDLRKGGLVIYFRHGAMDQTGSSDEAADMMKCETRRNIFGTDASQTKRITESLRRMLSTPPKATNAVIVSYTANLREAAGIWPKPEGATNPRHEKTC